MRLLVLLVALAASTVSAAAPALPPPLPPPLPPLVSSFPLGVPLPEFARQVLGEVLHKNYTLAPEFVALQDVVGVQLNGVSSERAERLLVELLESRGFELRRGDVYRVVPRPVASKPEPLATPPKEYFFYRPVNRTVDYFADYLPGLFPDIYFSFARRTPVPESASVAPGAAALPQQPVQQISNVESRKPGAEPLDSFYALGPASQLRELKLVLANIDIPVPKVEIHAALYEVQSEASSGFSLNVVISALHDKLRLNIGAPSSTNVLSFLSADFSLVFSALSGDSRFRTLTAPSLIAVHGKQSVFQVGAAVPTLGAIQPGQNGQAAVQSVETRETGSILRVTPSIGTDLVTLALSFELSDAVPTTTGVSSSPTILKRLLQTTVTAKSGSFVVLGGLSASRETFTGNDWFFLPTSRQNGKKTGDLVLLLYVRNASDVKEGEEPLHRNPD